MPGALRRGLATCGAPAGQGLGAHPRGVRPRHDARRDLQHPPRSVPRRRPGDLESLARAVRGLDADLLALQEVDRNQPRSHGADLTAVAAEAMGAVDHRSSPRCAASGLRLVAATGAEQPDSRGVRHRVAQPVPGDRLAGRAPPGCPRRSRAVRRQPAAALVRDEPRVAIAAAVESPRGRSPSRPPTCRSSVVEPSAAAPPRPVARRRSAAAGADGRPQHGTRPGRVADRHAPLALGRTFPADGPREQLDHVLADGAVRARGLRGPAAAALGPPGAGRRPRPRGGRLTPRSAEDRFGGRCVG